MTNDNAAGSAIVEWFRVSLEHDDGMARAARARLRRCQSPVEALAISETHDLHRRLKIEGFDPRPDQLALLAATFAGLKDIQGNNLAHLFGETETKTGPRKLSELRFQSLIRIRSHRDLLVPLRRAFSALGSSPACNGRSLGEDLYWWNERVRNKWCFEYFGASTIRHSTTNEEEDIQ